MCRNRPASAPACTQSLKARAAMLGCSADGNAAGRSGRSRCRRAAVLEDPHFDGKPATVILRGLGELSRLRARSFDTGWAWAFASAFGTNRFETHPLLRRLRPILLWRRKFALYKNLEAHDASHLLLKALRRLPCLVLLSSALCRPLCFA